MTNRLIDPQLLERPLAVEWPRLRTRLRVLILACLSSLVLVIPPVALADDFVCGIAGNPAPVTVTGGSFDNVVVPEGGRCFMQFSEVRGNVTALPDSLLTIIRTNVGGNILGDKADMVQVAGGNTIGGDIHIKEGGPNTVAAQEVLIGGNTLTNGDIVVQKMKIEQGLLVGFTGENYLPNGNVTVEDNVIVAGTAPSAGMRIDSQQIAKGNLHVFKNTGPGAKSVMSNNVVNGDIQCYENEAPFVGGPNTGRAPNQPPPFMSGRNQCFGTPGL
jgi:hypothetical protein